MSVEKIAVVTGANRGIGKETALNIAQSNYTVVLACRNIRDAEKVCEEIRFKSNNKNVFALELDLCSIQSVKNFVQSFTEKFKRINLLVNNAGITTQKYVITRDGFESTMQTNVFGPYVLTKLLLPYFEKENSRIVNLSSDFYRFGRFAIDKINQYHWIKAYAASKYAVLLLSLELAEQLKESGIKVNAVHPGVVKTNIMMTNKWYDSIINFILKPIFIDEHEGAKTSTYVALSDEVSHQTGGYYKNCKLATVPTSYNQMKLQKQLIEYCEKVVPFQ